MQTVATKSLRDFVLDLDQGELEPILSAPGQEPVLVEGLAASAPTFLIARAFLQQKKSILVLCQFPKTAEALQSDLEGFLGEDQVRFFPHREGSIYDGHSPFGHTSELRFQTLESLLRKEPCVVIATVQAFMQKIVPPRELLHNILRLEVGQEFDLRDLRSSLVQMGFAHAPVVEEIGQFSVRGGIVDIFPYLADQPLRVEFWGDEIESIRKFDIFSQRSLDRLEIAQIFPLQEFMLDEDERRAGLDAMAAEPDAGDAIKNLERKLLSQSRDSGLEWYAGWFKRNFASILDYLPQPGLVFEVESNLDWRQRHNELARLYAQCHAKARSHGMPLFSPPDQLLWNIPELEEKLRLHSNTRFGYFAGTSPAVRFTVKEQPRYLAAVASFVEDFKVLHANGFSVHVLCDNRAQAERLEELLGDDAVWVQLLIGTITQGFLIEEWKLALYTDHQIFSRYSRKIKYRRYKGGVSIPSFEALTPGDYVVHADHGIGRFTGIERVSTGDGHRDCMVLVYAEGNKLFVPVESFDRIQKYVGKDATPPTLSHLGTKAWEKLKERAKQVIAAMARELLELYAKRKFQPGYAFGPDTHWQKEFEDAFIYEETADQVKAIAEVKMDMEKPHPMDRLIAGDVGFGKTEVAMRAAFKCVMEGKQTAVLVPTTILAAQHLQTFRERMADFPVKIEMLSRFVGPKEQKRVVARIAQGDTNIVIGTHRLLSKDIRFKDLGTLIVDEEHRFGVRHKEKIKQIRSNVDVISMTATPIPRTLHMSMMGVRDVSLINTPPLNRLPVQTRVTEYNEEIIAEAIQHELSRQGQVYFVYNRVATIEEAAQLVERLVPGARVATAHGQMEEDDLETIMDSFMRGQFDVLVSTVIIESGLDIPNVNTLIVNRADTFGLAQLYQLRGRVGRSSVQAYAYLLTPPPSLIRDDALRRLKALEQFTDLGSGFQIAMRDLEIRGAGNILGTEQHGFIAAVGFEMYMRLLKETMQEIKGEGPAITVQPKMDIDVEAFLPETYIEDREQRVALYQKISQAENLESLHQMTGELSDRFGELPREARSLLAIMSMKLVARQLYFGRVAIGFDRLLLEFAKEYEPEQKKLGILVERIGRPFEFLYEKPLKISVELSETDPYLKLQQAKRVMEALSPEKTGEKKGEAETGAAVKADAESGTAER